MVRLGLDQDRNATIASFEYGYDERTKGRVKKKPALYKASDRDEYLRLSAFQLAVCLNRLECVKQMLEFDADALFPEAVRWAAAAGLLELLNYLCDAGGMDVDGKSIAGSTALHYGAYFGQFDVVESLCIHRRAFINSETCESYSPIMAALDGQLTNDLSDGIAIARFLLERKPDVNARNLNGDNVISMSMRAGDVDTLQTVLQNRDVDLSVKLERFGNSLLHKAVLFAENEHLSCLMISVLLANGHPVDVTNSEDKTALYYAAVLSKTSIVVLLLNSGANPNHRDAFGNSPLHFAYGPASMRALLERGVDPNVQNNDGYTPLHVMQSFGNHICISILRSYSCNETLVTRFGEMTCRTTRNCYVLPFFSDDYSAADRGGIILEAASSPNANQTIKKGFKR